MDNTNTPISIAIGKHVTKPYLEKHDCTLEDLFDTISINHEAFNKTEGNKKKQHFLCTTSDYEPAYKNNDNISKDAIHSVIIIDGDSGKASKKSPTCSASGVASYLASKDIESMVLTTHSNTFDHPKWRAVIVCKCTNDQLETTTKKIVSEIQKDGLDLNYAKENRNISQAWFFGGALIPDLIETHKHLSGQPYEAVDSFDGEISIISDSKRKTTEAPRDKAPKREIEEGELTNPVDNILSGDDFHESILKLSTQRLRNKLSVFETQVLIKGLMDQSEGRGDSRWQDRYDDVDRIVMEGAQKMNNPQPMPLYNVETEKFPINLLPSNIVTSAEEVSRFTFMPLSYAIRGMFPMVCTGFGNTHWIREKNGLIIPINSTQAMTGPSGSYKSSMFETLSNPVTKMEMELCEKWHNNKHFIQAQKKANDLKLKRMVKKLELIYEGDKDKIKKANFGPFDTEDALLREIALLSASEEKAGYEPELYIQDATDQGAARSCYEQGGSVTYATSEASELFDNLDGTKFGDGKKPNDGFFLKSCVGETFKSTRAHSNNGATFKIYHAVSNGLLFIQPSELYRYLENPTAKSKGNLARITVTDEPLQMGHRLIAEDDTGLDEAKLSGYYNIVETLIDKKFSDSESKGRVVYDMNNDTRKLYIEIANRNERKFLDDEVASVNNKITSKTLKDAYIIQTLDGKVGENLKSEYLEAADQMAEYQERRDAHLYQMGEISKYYTKARETLDWLINSEQRFAKYESEGFSLTDLKNRLRDNGNSLYEFVDELLIPLCSYGWLNRTKTSNNRGYRFFINFTVEDAQKEIKRGKLG